MLLDAFLAALLASATQPLDGAAPPAPALHAPQTAGWPGNVPQLGHPVEPAAVHAAGEGAQQLEPRHLFPERPLADDAPLSYQDATRRFQTQLVRRVLEEVDWNVSEAARRLGLGRSHVHQLVSRFGVTPAR